METEEVRKRLIDIGARRFFISKLDQAVHIEQREYSRLRADHEWGGVVIEGIRRAGWRFEIRDHLPVAIS